MKTIELSPRFLEFLGEYATQIGKDPALIIEESTAQAILRHNAAVNTHQTDSALLMPEERLRQLWQLLPDIDPHSQTVSPFGTVMEQLPDRNWTYQLAKLGEWWILLIGDVPQPLPAPLELKAQETSQAYVWVFGFEKSCRVLSSNQRILVVF